MNISEVVKTAPVDFPRTVRAEEVRVVTTSKAGKIVPLAYVPMLREDRVSRGKLRVKLHMQETLFPLMNAVAATVMVHFIPWSAFARFQGMDEFNRSYQGIAETYNSTVIPFFPTINFDKTAEFWKTMGVHWVNGAAINQMPVEAYNLLVNWRRAARSAKIATRSLTDTTLAGAFWQNPLLSHIVPDFDASLQDGDVSLVLSSTSVPIRGLGIPTAAAGTVKTAQNVKETGNVAATYARAYETSVTTGGPLVQLEAAGYIPQITADLAAVGLKFSLANLDMAKKTAAFARLREAMQGTATDDHLLDQLMEGIRIPDEAYRQPILLDRRKTIFGYSERFATDAANLKKSVTEGEAMVELNFRTPPMNSGGVLLVTAEIVPEQLFERMKDSFLGITSPAALPNALRDYLDPQKVVSVKNEYVDVLHGTPTGTFGFAPLNHEWKRSLLRAGGRYYRPNPDTFVEDRQRFWAVEQLNPALTTDFYVVNTLPHTVFADSVSDPFEHLVTGLVEIEGNTQFGVAIEEKRSAWTQVDSEIDKSIVVSA